MMLVQEAIICQVMAFFYYSQNAFLVPLKDLFLNNLLVKV